jgi:hypothetical protein
MAFEMEDLTCAGCGIHWNWDGPQWFLRFTDDRPPGENVLLWTKCPACVDPQVKFAADVAGDIHWLPLTDHG